MAEKEKRGKTWTKELKSFLRAKLKFYENSRGARVIVLGWILAGAAFYIYFD